VERKWTEADRRRGRAEARGAALTAGQRGQGRSRAEQALGEEEEKGGGPGTGLQNSKMTRTLG
jgi:hypothetical protein